MKIVNPRSPKHSSVMFSLGELCEADVVEYVGGDKDETYHITKGDTVFEFYIGANKVDGGYLQSIKNLEEK